MKKVFLLASLFVMAYGAKAQFMLNDSLQGFDLAKTVSEAHQKNLEGAELKTFVNMAKKSYVKTKFNLVEDQAQEVPLSKYGSNTTSNFPCANEDFEGIPTGTMISGYGWNADQNVSYNHICSTTLIPMFTNTSAVVVYSTPVTDAILGTIGTSPFGGAKVVKLNNTGYQVARIRSGFPVSSANYLFNYAYKGVLEGAHHGCCADPYLMFRFYDCLGNLIPGMGHTDVLGTPSCVITSTTNWAASTVSVGYHYTPNWEVFSQNLSAYIGSCVTMEVIASGCLYAAHKGYMYFDAKCSDGAAMILNGDTYQSPASSFTSCALTATLAGLPGFTNYQWQGPPASGIVGITSASITTTVSGTYTLVSSSGTLSNTQILNLVVDPGFTPAITGNNGICLGQTATLQVSGAGINTYSWSTGSTLQAISVSPTTSTTYSVIATNTLGCFATASATLAVAPIPFISLLTSATAICLGQSVNILATAISTPSYTWNTGATSNNINISPTLTTVYTVTGTTTSGCITSGSVTIAVNPLPQLQITQSSTSLCIGESATLIASGLPGNSYNWSIGGAFTPTIIVSPTVTSVYGVIATTSAGCTGSGSKTITVYPLPQIQLVATHAAICIGQSANFGVLGSNISNVLWNTGAVSLSVTVSPTVSSAYVVTVTSAYGCSSSQSDSLAVNLLPQVQIASSSATVCAGKSATLTVSGSSLTGYQWAGGQTSSSIVVSPTMSTQYSVVATDVKGCSSDTNYLLSVVICIDTNWVGIDKQTLAKKRLIIFPNPSGGSFEIKGYESEKGWLLNDLGQILSEFYLNADNNYTFKISILAKGIYFVSSTTGSEKVIVK